MNLKASSRRLLYFWGSWCPVCKQMEPMLHSRAWLIPIIKINIDRNPKYAHEYRVTGTPTFCLLEHNKELRRMVGAVSSAQLEEFLHD